MTGPIRRAVIRTNPSTFVLAGNVALALLFAILIMKHGIPSLRQDWNWPFAPVEVQRFIIDTWSGWDPKGIGAPAPYPSSYILAVPLGLLLRFFGPYAALYLFLVAAGIAVAAGANALAVRVGASPLLALGAAAFALFNPWVYVKVVAGHVVMILAYGATMLFLAEIARSKPRWHALALFMALIFAQIQFFIIAGIVLVARVREQSARKALLFAIVIAMPTACGIVANWSSLSGIPYTLAWQQSQSVALADAPFLIGYFASYAVPVSSLFRASVLLFAGVAMAGLYTALRNGTCARYAVGWFVAGTMFCLLAAGTKGPLSVPYAFAVSHVAATGVYRELFDLLAYVAIAYVALAGLTKWRALDILTVLAACTAVLAWLVVPPAHYFVNRASVPKFELSVPNNSRYALLPPFQPMSLGDRGSGEDPDAFIRNVNVTPLNVYLASGVEAAAFASYLQTGNTEMLSSLSVATIVTRPWLQSDRQSLKNQLGAGFIAAEGRRTGIRRIDFLPELAVQDVPLIASIPPRLGDGNMFWADSRDAAYRMTSFRSVSAPNDAADASLAWVSASLTFSAHPGAFQALGGAATSSRVAMLALPRSKFILVFARGELKSGNRVVAQNTNGYEWIRLSNASPLRLMCNGYCVVSGTSDVLPDVPPRPSPRSYEQLRFKQVMPWLLTANLPPTHFTALRYNVAYNRWWFAYVDGRVQRHMRLDSLVNGWSISGAATPRHLIVINIASALQLLLEILGIMAVCAVCTLMIVKRKASL